MICCIYDGRRNARKATRKHRRMQRRKRDNTGVQLANIVQMQFDDRIGFNLCHFHGRFTPMDGRGNEERREGDKKREGRKDEGGGGAEGVRGRGGVRKVDEGV